MKIIPVLGYLLCFGISDCLWIIPNKRYPIILSMTIRSVVTCLLFSTLFFITKGYFGNLDYKLNDWANAIAISCVSYGGLYCYVRSLKYEQASVVAPVTSILTSVLGLLFTVLFFNETLTIKVGCCLIAVFVGITLCFSRQSTLGTKVKFNKGTIFSIAAAILWAISYTFFKTPIDKLGVVTFSLILEVTILAINVFFLIINKDKVNFSTLKFNMPMLSLAVIGCLIFIGTLLNSYSYKLFPLLYLNVLGKLGVIIPILYCVIFLKEKLSLLQISGISILVLSAIVIVL
jgi:drug/metabolite transporter (DMT)-like permease